MQAPNLIIFLTLCYVLEKLPDFDKMQPVKMGKLNQVDLSPRQRDDNFGIKFDAYVKVCLLYTSPSPRD